MTRHDVGALVERAFWYVLVGAVGLGVSVLRDISKSIAELNASVAVVVTQVSNHDRRLAESEARLVDLEANIRRRK